MLEVEEGNYTCLSTLRIHCSTMFVKLISDYNFQMSWRNNFIILLKIESDDYNAHWAPLADDIDISAKENYTTRRHIVQHLTWRSFVGNKQYRELLINSSSMDNTQWYEQWNVMKIKVMMGENSITTGHFLLLIGFKEKHENDFFFKY